MKPYTVIGLAYTAGAIAMHGVAHYQGFFSWQWNTAFCLCGIAGWLAEDCRREMRR